MHRKLTIGQARMIRRLDGEVSRRDLARRYEISVSTVGAIVRGEAYPDPEGPAEETRQRLMGYLGDTYQPEDDELISLYCLQDSLERRIRDELESTGLTTEYTNKAGATNEIKHPLLQAQDQCAQRKIAILVNLGLTRKQRLRLTAGADPDDDGFEDF